LNRFVRGVVAVTLCVAAIASAPAAHAQVASYDVRTASATLDGRDVDVDVYRPAADETAGVAILAHGFTRERSRHRDLARALADAGIVAVVPDLPNVMNHWGNGDALVDLAHALERGALGLDPVARSRLVLVGTSAGGLASVLAAAKLPGIAGWVGLDPVDRTGSGIRAASALEAPAVVLLAEPSTCNLFGSGRSIAHAAPRLLRAELIRGASHCDFESPTTKFCRVVCGESSSQMRAIARGEAVDAVVEILRGGETSSVGDGVERAQ
jgi:dienelactone hydrolase